MLTNAERAARVREWLKEEFIEGAFNDPQTALGDALSDMRHLAVVDGLDWDKALAAAAMHFHAETFEELTGEPED